MVRRAFPSRGRKDTCLVLRAENSGTDNAANTDSTDQSSRAESSLPLATDVVRLPCENTRHVGVAGDGCEEDAEIADAVVLGEPEKRKTFRIVRGGHSEGVASAYQ